MAGRPSYDHPHMHNRYAYGVQIYSPDSLTGVGGRGLKAVSLSAFNLNILLPYRKYVNRTTC